MADDVWTKDNVLSGLATKEQIDTLIQTNREVKSLLSDFMSFYRRDNWVEKISLRNEPQMLPLNGYRHIGIWVSEIDLPMTVKIGLPGIQSTSVELVAGLNALPDIDGMFISGSVGQIANVVRSNDPLTVSAATVLGQQGTLTNPVIIEQTGSIAPDAVVPLSFGPFPYTNWVSGSGALQSFSINLSGLSRNRKAMTIIIFQNMGSSLTGDAWPMDSLYLSNNGVLAETNSVGSITAANNMQVPIYYAPGSSFNINVDQINWNTGLSTLPTSGTCSIVVLQIL